MSSSGILQHVALLRSEVLKGRIASIIRETIIDELGTLMLRLLVISNVVPSLPILVTLMMEEICSFITSILTRSSWNNNQGDGSLNLKLYYNRRSVGQSGLVLSHHLGIAINFSLTSTEIVFRQLRVSYYGEACKLQLLLGLASAAFLKFESFGIHDHISLPQF
jgi:hypothetical protein